MDNQIQQLREQLQKQEKLASLGLLSAGIAHEIQNPLNFVINFSKMSEKLLDDLMEIVGDNVDKLSAEDREDMEDITADLKENMSKIVEHGERAISIIQDILLVSRGKEGAWIPSDLCKIVEEYTRLSFHAMRANHQGFNVAIHEEYDRQLPLMNIIPQDISRAVLNLMNNAFYAVWQRAQEAAEGYQPEVSVSVARSGDDAVVTIADNGVGMTDEAKQHLYENFFTTKPAGHGTGLGMGITRDIIENRHGGTLSFDSTAGQGTTFTITIPMKK